ncbi:UDP-N-acetylmuramoyl-L-alanine--D-glutamate ligase [Devosia neptuniae]|jgi:UDP-N-acetylmuramoylalanine--D-glutamate ligase|uniref:UDP-N-acetylmuramoyl-L-alanine--D-glutamate ligase n=1 Tax=Devosia TaxID=46913 RepID=UPI0022AFCCF8|nr:UDP-N-acetylmuramoyl-L-alanine--D-glutamate ligase [Devosia neptuniae]MCZ4347169.1 UDP-N-acetylmuramoyl-L-alanine--D-glutamate ligase [Devosia neptuniae]|tara:strand:- start:28311 stop:29612 length:1302 start_codon:yes stop_codon:yes gene_type:complete
MLFEEPVLIYGAGREALSTRAFLKAVQPDLKVFVTVDSGTADIPDTAFMAPEDIKDAIRAHRFGDIIKSPGVSRYKPVFDIARDAGIAVTSNLNLWGHTYRDGRTVIAITGTKGKSTTATLLHLMLTRSRIDAGLAGNVGLAPLDIADKHAVVIFELSSYQTADMNFLPDIAAVTNLYPEHVDWHGSIERYYADKLHLIDRDGGFPVALGAGAKGNALVAKATRDHRRLLRDLTSDEQLAVESAAARSRLRGAHNLDNALLAAQIALAAGATLDGIVDGIRAFTPLPHRLEEHKLGGMTFVDDSISTTPEATKAALAAYPGRRLALIAGGHERAQDYGDLAERLAGYGVTMLACLPVTGERLATATARAAPEITVLTPPDLEAAMKALVAHKDAFDAVILSPGAPSYNQFKNFEERGDRFVALAKALFAETPA